MYWTADRSLHSPNRIYILLDGLKSKAHPTLHMLIRVKKKMSILIKIFKKQTHKKTLHNIMLGETQMLRIKQMIEASSYSYCGVKEKCKNSQHKHNKMYFDGYPALTIQSKNESGPFILMT